MSRSSSFRGTLASLLAWTLTAGLCPALAQDAAQAAPGKIHIAIIEGDGAINNVRQRVAREPIVQVEDENRRPIAGAAVTFTLPRQGASATFQNGARSLTVMTDSNGQAVARGLQPNNVNGKYEIRINASHDGRTSSTTITQTNAIVGAAAAGAGISGKLIAIIIAGAAAAAVGGVVAATRNGNDNGNGAVSRPVVITPGTPSVGGPQ
jgi:hypothetical protein